MHSQPFEIPLVSEFDLAYLNMGCVAIYAVVESI